MSTTLTKVLETDGPALRQARVRLQEAVEDHVPRAGPLTGQRVGEAEPLIPFHYDKPVQPWDLELCMESSGLLFVDARRTDAIEYAFRLKGGRKQLRDDLRKAIHCLEAAVRELERQGIEA